MPSSPRPRARDPSVLQVEGLNGVDVRALAARARPLTGEALGVGDADVAGGAETRPRQVEVAVVRVVAGAAVAAGPGAEVHPRPVRAARDVDADALELDV